MGFNVNAVGNIIKQSEKIKIKPSTMEVLRDKGVSLEQFKEGFRIRDKEIEHNSVMGIFDPVRNVGTTEGINCPLIKDAFSDVHNHPTSKILSGDGLKSFSFEDLKNSLGKKPWATMFVSTFDTLFKFKKNGLEIEYALNQAKNKLIIDKHKKVFGENFEKLINLRIDKLTRTTGKPADEINSMNKQEIIRFLKENPKIKQKIDNTTDAFERLVNHLYDKSITQIANETNSTYTKYNWDELMPNVFRSRGKK